MTARIILPEEERGVLLYRVGKVSEPLEDRMYKTTNTNAPAASVETLKKILNKKYDQVILHDEIDSCLILIPDSGEVGEIPCKIHHKPI